MYGCGHGRELAAEAFWPWCPCGLPDLLAGRRCALSQLGDLRRHT